MHEAGEEQRYPCDSVGMIMLYSPLHGSKHSKGKFHLALTVPRFPDDDACVTALLDGNNRKGSTWIYSGVPRDDQVSMEIDVGTGWHDLTLAIHSTGTGRRQADLFCRKSWKDSADDEKPLMVEIHVSFQVFQEQLKSVQVDHAFPPMELTCNNAFSRRILHLCRPSLHPLLPTFQFCSGSLPGSQTLAGHQTARVVM